MRKKLSFIILLLIMCSSCSLNNGNDEINVMNWSSYIPNEVIINFEKETGVNVNYSTYSSNEECLAKVSSAKEGTHDLIFPSDYMVEIMKNRGLLESLDKKKLYNISNIKSNYLSLEYDKNNEYTLPFIAATTIISVNREFISDTITSYNDLLNPEYENEIVLIDDQRIIIGMGLLANGFDMNSTNYEELKIAKEWLEKLKPNIKAYDSDSPKNFLISKEASIAVLWNAEGALATQENPNIQNIFPSEGIALSIDNFAIPKGAKNIENTYKFIDYILREDVMKIIIESYPYKNLNYKTEKLLSDNYLNSIASNIPDAEIDNAIFVKNIGSDIKIYDKIWAMLK